LETPPVQKGAFLQTCSNVMWDAATNKVQLLAGQPVESDKMYVFCYTIVLPFFSCS
jgi:hypothetical protein